MKKIRIRKSVANPIKTYNESASSYWFDDIDTDFSYKVNNRKQVDHTKLASAQRAIGNFVNIVTGKQIPVHFQNNDQSYTDGKSVTIGSKIEDKNFDSTVGLALHEGSHIALTNFKLLDGCYIGSGFHSHIAMRGGDPNMDMTEDDILKVKDLFNWIEDRRIDYHIYTSAPGYRKYYEAMYEKYFNARIVDKALKSDEKTDEDWDSYMFRIINLTNPNRRIDALEVLPQVWDLIDLKNINRLKTSDDALNVAIEVYKLIRKQVNDSQSNTYRLFISISGQPDGNETLTVNPRHVGSIVDSSGSPLSTDIMLIPVRLFPYTIEANTLDINQQVNANRVTAGQVVISPNSIGTIDDSDLITFTDQGEVAVQGEISINSDVRLKTNIVSLGSTLINLLTLDGKRYKMINDDYDDYQIGLLAQDVQKVFPELVMEDSNGILSVNYQALIPVLVNALKEMDENYRELENELSELEKLID